MSEQRAERSASPLVGKAGHAERSVSRSGDGPTVTIVGPETRLSPEDAAWFADRLRTAAIEAGAAPAFVPRGCLNVRWNDDGTFACIHDDSMPCDLPDHTTISTYVRAIDLVKPVPFHDPNSAWRLDGDTD